MSLPRRRRDPSISEEKTTHIGIPGVLGRRGDAAPPRPASPKENYSHRHPWRTRPPRLRGAAATRLSEEKFTHIGIPGVIDRREKPSSTPKRYAYKNKRPATVPKPKKTLKRSPVSAGCRVGYLRRAPVSIESPRRRGGVAATRRRRGGVAATRLHGISM